MSPEESKFNLFYNTYRTACYNKLYYGRRLSKFKSFSKTTEIILAIATSSAIGGWLIWKNETGAHVWVFISGIATLIAVIKPIVNFSGQIERYSKLFAGHSDTYYDLKKICDDIQIERKFSSEMDSLYDNTLDRIKLLAPEDDLTVDNKLAEKIYKVVNQTIPPESLWMPINS